MSYELGIRSTREFSYSEQSGCFQCKIRVYLPAGAEGLLLRELRGNLHYIGELLKTIGATWPKDLSRVSGSEKPP